MKTTLGVFAHVDAGKTTFCESLLYLTSAIKTAGRVDYGSSLLDHDEQEKRRGITIFSDIAVFSHGGRDYNLIDTPGHIDFSAEMERALTVLDAAVLVVSAKDGVQSHTMTLCRLLRERQVPVYIFINKTDQPGADTENCLLDIKSKLNINCRLLGGVSGLKDSDFALWLCEHDDEFMERFLDDESIISDAGYVLSRTKEAVKSGEIVLAASGSALRQTGILELLELIGATYLDNQEVSDTFAARVWKTGYDAKGQRLTYFKCLGGSLSPRDELSYGDDMREKVNEIRVYQGKAYSSAGKAEAGDIAAVTGLSAAVPGMGLGALSDLSEPVLRPALGAAVLLNGNPFDSVMDCLKKLEAQDPLLGVDYEPGIKQISLKVMGKIQLEVLKEVILERFGLSVDFGECKVLYRETIAKPVMGYGHFEPLRHYAEVHLRLEPNPGGGLSFDSELSVNVLPRQHQNSVRHHLLARDHKGILTGSSLTDVKFVLTKGAVHLEHTHGGDLREAAWRAVRQGLEKAESVLLEPFYEFDIDVESAQAGRVMSDITRLHGSSEPPVSLGERVRIHGSGPVETFIDYQTELLSFTKGQGGISFRLLGYFPCHNTGQAAARIAYEKDRDMVNVSSSVFCAKGAGFEIKWHEAEKWMHLM